MCTNNDDTMVNVGAYMKGILFIRQQRAYSQAIATLLYSNLVLNAFTVMMYLVEMETQCMYKQTTLSRTEDNANQTCIYGLFLLCEMTIQNHYCMTIVLPFVSEFIELHSNAKFDMSSYCKGDPEEILNPLHETQERQGFDFDGGMSTIELFFDISDNPMISRICCQKNRFYIIGRASH